MIMRSLRLLPKRFLVLACATLALASVALVTPGCGQEPQGNPSTAGQFVQFSVGAPENRMHALAWIEDHWQTGFEAMAIEALRFTGSRESKQAMIDLLEQKTGQNYGADTDAWQRWLWRSRPPINPRYAEVKAALFGMVDVNYRAYFLNSPATDVRLDEVQWVGLRRVDDLAALVNPAMSSADDSKLGAKQLVHGVVVNGESRAYARAVIALHGVVRDSVGGTDFLLVNDRFTGAGAAYELGHEHQALAVSGFLHRGDPLLYDPSTQSLWSSLRGQPVVGPLVAKNLQLKQLPTVTAPWGAWRKRHPDSLVTREIPSEQRYLAGQANYRKFVAEKRLVASSATPELAAEENVLGISQDNKALAIPLSLLRDTRIYSTQLGGTGITLLSTRDNATRAYATGEVIITAWENANHVVAQNGELWRITEHALLNDAGVTLPRIATRQARWAAWKGAFEDSQVAQP